MKKAYIFGAGVKGKEVYEIVKQEYNILGFLDNDKTKHGCNIDGIAIHEVEILKDKEHLYDEIIIASLTGFDLMKNQLIDMGVEPSQITRKYVESFVKAREDFLQDFSKMVYEQNLKGDVAEAGVFQGEFARQINSFFHTKDLYLFDTFTGFDSRDISVERKQSFSIAIEGDLNITSEALVLGKMKYKDRCVIKKGYFPESAKGLEKNIFCFVNLDMDLYQPTLEGLRFFYPKMVDNGVILVHDYFRDQYPGVKEAVNIFINETKERIIGIPIGDGYSLAIIK